jgi:hypothetical protein
MSSGFPARKGSILGSPATLGCIQAKIHINSSLMRKKLVCIKDKKKAAVLYQFPKPVQPPPKPAA